MPVSSAVPSGDPCIQSALEEIRGSAPWVEDLSLVGVNSLLGEFRDFVLVTVEFGTPHTKTVPYVVDCQELRVWHFADFREPLPPPWDRLSAPLRNMMRTDNFPQALDVLIGISVTEPLLTGETVFVPDGVDPRIWQALDPRERVILSDYWKRYDNVPGEPIFAPEEHEKVIDKAHQFIRDYNDAIT